MPAIAVTPIKHHDDPAHRRSILVVDDQGDMRRMLRLVLEQGGFNVFTASDGDEALSQFEAHHPDAVVLDLHLPTVQGWTVLDEIKRRGATPVLVMTGITPPEDVARQVMSQADLFLLKPFNLMRLLEYLNRHFA